MLPALGTTIPPISRGLVLLADGYQSGKHNIFDFVTRKKKPICLGSVSVDVTIHVAPR
jgi:hypothetical protein